MGRQMLKKGFTLMEVMLSLLLVGTVLVAVLANTSVMVRGVSYGDDLSQAVVIATNEMEELSYSSRDSVSKNTDRHFIMTTRTQKISKIQNRIVVEVVWESGSYILQRDFYQGIL